MIEPFDYLSSEKYVKRLDIFGKIVAELEEVPRDKDEETRAIFLEQQRLKDIKQKRLRNLRRDQALEQDRQRMKRLVADKWYANQTKDSYEIATCSMDPMWQSVQEQTKD